MKTKIYMVYTITNITDNKKSVNFIQQKSNLTKLLTAIARGYIACPSRLRYALDTQDISNFKLEIVKSGLTFEEAKNESIILRESLNTAENGYDCKMLYLPSRITS